jgi:hypothetical protein
MVERLNKGVDPSRLKGKFDQRNFSMEKTQGRKKKTLHIHSSHP